MNKKTIFFIVFHGMMTLLLFISWLVMGDSLIIWLFAIVVYVITMSFGKRIEAYALSNAWIISSIIGILVALAAMLVGLASRYAVPGVLLLGVVTQYLAFVNMIMPIDDKAPEQAGDPKPGEKNKLNVIKNPPE